MKNMVMCSNTTFFIVADPAIIYSDSTVVIFYSEAQHATEAPASDPAAVVVNNNLWDWENPPSLSCLLQECGILEDGR